METLKNGKLIHDWIIRNHPPLTWSYIAVKIGDHFLENEVDPFFIVQSTEFDKKLVGMIDHILKSHYDSSLPDHLVH